MGRSGTVLSPILVGRDGHLDLAEARLADAAAGRGRTLLITGEAGIGKTRLLGAILRGARAAGFDTAKGDIAPADHALPGALLLDLARTMRDVSALSAAGEDVLARWRAAADPDAGASRALVRDVADRLRSAGVGPLVLAFEDLQWADDLSLDAIAELARTIETRPVLVLAAYRHDEAADDRSFRAWRSRLLTQRLADEVRLDRLTLDQTATMVTLLLDTGQPAPRPVVAAVHERSDGVPLHIEELVAAVRARGPVDAAAIRDVGVPDTIEDAVLARTAGLSPEAQAVARAGAVLGRCFVPEVLAGVMDVPVAELEGPLEELVDHAVLYPHGAVDVGYHDFRHQLLRDALYRHTPARERRRFHARAAEFGGRLAGSTEVHASLHYAEAGLREEAYRAALAGAREASQVAAHREALELYKLAIDNQPDDVPAQQRAELLLGTAFEAMALEDMEGGEPMAWAAAAAFREAGEVVRAIDATTYVLAIWRRDGHPVQERIDLCGRLLEEIDGLPDHPDARLLRVEVAYLLAYALIDAGRADAARETIGAARRAAPPVGSAELDLAFDELEGILLATAGDVDAGLSMLHHAVAVAREDGLETPTLSGLRDATVLAARAMDYETSRRTMADGIRYGAEVEQVHCAHVMAGTGTIVDWATGAWDAADGAARQILVDRGCRRGAAAAHWARGYVALGRGDCEGAEAQLHNVLDWGERSGALDLILPATWGLAESAWLSGEPATAAAMAEGAVARAGAGGDRLLAIPFVVTGVRGHIAAGRPGDARRWLDEVAAHLAPVTARSASIAIQHARGLVALAEGSPGVARPLLEGSVAGWDALGRVWEASWARLDLASALARSNRHATAVALAGQVRATATALGSPSLLERAEAIARQGRGRVVEVEPWHPLTTREFEVARLVSEGRTNAEIAHALGIAPKTASAHVEHILAKLGAARRAEIAAWTSHVPVPSSTATGV